MRSWDVSGSVGSYEFAGARHEPPLFPSLTRLVRSKVFSRIGSVGADEISGAASVVRAAAKTPLHSRLDVREHRRRDDDRHRVACRPATVPDGDASGRGEWHADGKHPTAPDECVAAPREARLLARIGVQVAPGRRRAERRSSRGSWNRPRDDRRALAIPAGCWIEVSHARPLCLRVGVAASCSARRVPDGFAR